MKKKLVVIPSDPLDAYSHNSEEYLTDYFNPKDTFDKVYLLSPLEKAKGFRYGMHVIPTETGQLQQMLLKIRPHVVRAYGGYWACEFACTQKIQGIPVVVSIHDDRESLLYPSIRCADMVWCTSTIVRNLVTSKNIPKEKTRILPNRVDISRFRPLQNHPTAKKIREQFNGKKIILTVARKTHQKNTDNILRAAALLPNDYVFVLAGKNDPKYNYFELTKKLQIEHQLVWIDYIPNDILPYWYSACDCFFLPSRHEGFGIVFIEAAACGAPIVTSSKKPMSDYLTNFQSAFLVKEFESPISLAAAVKAICLDDNMSKKLSEGARKASMYFEKSKIDNIELNLYNEFLRFND